jgi:hypothetical protein
MHDITEAEPQRTAATARPAYFQSRRPIHREAAE